MKKGIWITVIIMLILVFSGPYLKRVRKISESWNKYFEVLQSDFNIKVIKKNIFTGTMELTLDEEYNFEYTCEVTPLSMGGYGPHCDNYLNGEYIKSFGGILWYKNEKEITYLLKKYNKYIVEDNAEYIFKINNEAKLVEFFKELMKIDDMNTAYKLCKRMKKEDNKACPTKYMYVRDVTANGQLWGGYDLFEWAISNNL